MGRYIDAEKLKKAIEEKGLDCSFAMKMERLDTLALIDELQQEQPYAIGGVVHHALGTHWVVANQEQLCANLKQFPEGAEVEILIEARKEE